MNEENVIHREEPNRNTYTEITDATCDLRTVKILKCLMAGRDSELTAIMQYLYQHTISKGINNDLSQSLEQIAIKEMKHMQLLASAIVSFGGNPKYCCNNNFWNARYVNYGNVAREIIENDIASERQAIENYTRAIERVSNESLKKLLGEIIEDERHHITILSRFLT